MPARCLAPLCLTCGLFLSAPGAAQDLDGDWLGFAATAIHLGIIVPVLEQVTVLDGQAEQQGWTYPFTDRGCAGTEDDPPACAPPVSLGAVILTQHGDRLAAQPDGPQPNPFTHPGDAEFWPMFQLAGHEWHLRGNDLRLILSRDIVVEDEALTIERIYLRAPPGAAGMVFDYMFAAELSISRGLCGLDALRDSPADWDAFWALQARVHPVTAELRRINLQADRSRDDLALLVLLRDGQDAGTADASHIPEAARAAWLQASTVIRQGMALEPGRAMIESLRFPAQAHVARQAEACIEYFQSY